MTQLARVHRVGRLGRLGAFGLCAALACAAAAARAQPGDTYDLVIANGRVIDPESGLDAVRHVGIRGGKIAAVSETPLHGRRASSTRPRHVVVARLHRPPRARPAGGVVPDDGARRRHLGVRARGRHRRRRRRGTRRAKAGQIVNYGVAVGHIPARMKVLGDPGTGLLPAGDRRQRDRHRRADGGDGSDPARGAGAGRGRHGLRQRLHAGRADVGDRAHVPRRRRGRRLGAHPHARRAPGAARDDRRGEPPRTPRCTSCTSTRPPTPRSTRSSRRSRPRATPDRT